MAPRWKSVAPQIPEPDTRHSPEIARGASLTARRGSLLPASVLADFERDQDNQEEAGRGGAPDGRRASLGNIGIFVRQTGTGRQDARRGLRFERSHMSAVITGDIAVAGCRRWARSSTEQVAVLRKPGAPAFLAGVQTCGKLWTCAHCQSVAASRRAIEVQGAIDAWQARGGRVALLTMTLRHSLEQPLRESLEALKEAQRRMVRHRAYAEATKVAGLIGKVNAIEVTRGKSGWHPHVHALLFLADDADLPSLRDALSKAWQASLRGLGADATDERGVDLREGASVARYLAKMSAPEWGLADELARSGSKNGRAGSVGFWQLVDAAGDRAATPAARHRAAELVREFASATAGLSSMRWSPGLRDKLGLNAPAMTDAEATAPEERGDADVIALVQPADWREVARERAQVAALEAAERGGQRAVDELLHRLRAIHQGRPPDARHGAPPG